MAKHSRKKKQTPEERAEIDRLREEFNPTGVNQTAQAMVDSPPPVADRILEESEEAAQMEVANFQGDEVRGAAPMEEPTANTAEDLAELTAVADVEDDNAKPNSVVHPRFEVKYLQNAQALGIKGKAAKRSNWDWLSQQLASQVLTEKHKLKVDDFHALMAANGIDATKWSNRNKGWEGRLRMTGRVALQKVVANNGFLYLNGGTIVDAPADFIAKYRDKE